MAARLKIALQKNGGRLTEDSIKFLRSVGYGFSPVGDKLTVVSTGGEAQIFFMRAKDIPEKVYRGVVDIGIVGADVVASGYSKLEVLVENGQAKVRIDREANNKVFVFESLDFGSCRLAFASLKNSLIKGIKDLRNKRIATSYPQLVEAFLDKSGIDKYEIVDMSGSVEIAIESGEADAIADLVQTGRTLEAHNLQEIGGVFESQALIIANQKFRKSTKGKEILDNLRSRINAALLAADKKYLVLNCREKDLPKIKKIMPALEAPTILPLAKKGEFALQSVATEKEFWAVLPKLKKAGAKDILILNVEKIIP